MQTPAFLTDSTVLSLLIWAVPVLVFVLLAAVVLLFVRLSSLESRAREREARALETLLAAGRTVTDEQSRHFVNFLTLLDRGFEGSERRGVQLMETLLQRFDAQRAENRSQGEGAGAALREKIADLQKTLAGELSAMRAQNEAALSQIRESVDDKLQKTIGDRLSVSFKSVEEQLSAVHRGLGEMREMAQNVDGLRRILANVKTRGTFGEVQLGNILSEILTPGQYLTNVATRPSSTERVEFAVKLPGRSADAGVLLPIDAKFPLEDYGRLCAARENADKKAEGEAIKALANRIQLEAKKIHDKYVEPPATTEFAVLYLPVESLWAEVLSVPGLLEGLQRDFRVTVAGPTVLASLLNSLQMGFRTLAIEQKSSEVWQLLSVIKSEFARFSEVIDRAEQKMEGARSELGHVRTRTDAMARKLREVSVLEVPGEEPAEASQTLEGRAS